jgi:type VI secretion system secreted protein Hcp
MAAVDYFLKFDGIKGESTDAKHKEEIDVEAWSWGESNTGSAHLGGGLGAGKVSMQDFNFMMHLNKASPALMQACATGKHIKSATLTGRKAGKGQMDYLTFKFYDILVSSFQTSGAGEHPVESISFNYSKMDMEYFTQKADGSFAPGGRFKFDLTKLEAR